MVTRRVSEDLLAAAKSSLTRRVTSSLLRFAAKVSAIELSPNSTYLIVLSLTAPFVVEALAGLSRFVTRYSV